VELDLAGKVAVITGGSGGIGHAIAEGLCREGVDVVLCARNEDRLKKAAENLRKKYKRRTLAIPTDVTSASDIDAAAKKTERTFGGVDILINNAGKGSKGRMMDAPDEMWQYEWDLHVMAAVRFSRALVPLMRRRGAGVILNTTSICAKQPVSYLPIYNVTKAALAMFSKSLANELIGENIRVNCVSPGYVLTAGWKETAARFGEEEGITWEQYIDRLARETIPIRRFASPEEIANLVVFLCSPRASYCVGSTYYVDGGFTKVVT